MEPDRALAPSPEARAAGAPARWQPSVFLFDSDSVSVA